MRRGILKKSISALLLAFFVMFCASFGVKGSGGPRDVSSLCVYLRSGSSGSPKAVLTDGDYTTRAVLSKNAWVSIVWDDVPVDFVYYEWTGGGYSTPPSYTVELLSADGEITESFDGESYWNSGVAVEPGVHGVRLRMLDEGKLCTLKAYSGGAPKDYHPWQPTPDKTDFLVIATHPDDDVIFMGAIVPTYGVQRGLSGSILYLCSRERVRRSEALNGAWTMGLRTYPIFAGMVNVSPNDPEEKKAEFSPEFVEKTLVRYIRRVRPEIVVTHGEKGEYGHWQHMIVSDAARLAVIDAADPSYDPSSAKEFGAWQVKKLYLHLSPGEPIFITATEPLEAFGGLTAWEVAQEAYLCHASQNHANHPCNNRGVNSLEKFGLIFTFVGPDTGINDMFENVPEEDLTSWVEPVVTEAPTQAPTQAPTEAPTEAPAETPAPSPSPAPVLTAEPAVSPAPREGGIENAKLFGILAALLGTLVVLLVLVIVVLSVRKKRED